MGGKASDPNKAAMKLQREQMDRLDQLSLPELEEYMLQNPELVGLLDAETIDKSKMEGISLDSTLRDNQMKALDSLRQQSEEGLTATDKYAMEQMLGDVSAQQKSQQAGIESEMARRGMDSSGAALMAKLQAGQSGANSARDKAMQMAAQGQQNRMAALQGLGQQSGQMQQQDFARQAQTASAQDAIARANAMNRQNVAGANLAARQGIENQRANIANQQAQVGNQIKQQNFQNQMSRATGQGSVANAMSNIAGNAPQKPGGLQSALGGAASGAAIGSVVPGIGTGVGAAVGGAAGLLSSFEDGGVAGMSAEALPVQYQQERMKQESKQKEDKQHEKFKKDYMKRVREELTPAGDKARKEVTRAEDGALFNMDKMKQDAQNQRIGIGNDVTSEEIQTDQQAQDFLKKDESSGLDIGKSVGLLSKLLGDGKAPARKRLDVGSFNMPQTQNIMSPIGPQNFDNPYSQMRQAALADGGIPAYKCGGVHEAEDGGTMYASDGQGDIVDSGMESYAGDRVDAKINDGEAVLNVPQQQRFMDLVRGKISVDELGDDDIVEGVPRDYRDDLHEKIEEDDYEESDDSSKIRGLEKLLEMLGDE